MTASPGAQIVFDLPSQAAHVIALESGMVIERIQPADMSAAR